MVISKSSYTDLPSIDLYAFEDDPSSVINHEVTRRSGRRLFHCRGREPTPGTPSLRVVAEGTLIGK
jgi:hypothetical protein